MKNRKKILIASFALAAALLAAAGTIFAWFIKPQSSVVVVTGDARLQASGYYAVVSTEESAVPEYRPLDKTSLTKITDLDQNHYIAFRFDVTNQTETDVNLLCGSENFRNIFSVCFPITVRNAASSPPPRLRLRKLC